MKKTQLIFIFIVFSFMIGCQQSTMNTIGKRWSEERAWAWHHQNGWMVGTNFSPSTAINQLEFWQAETFDPQTIDRELQWSADLGMTLHRVYLHNLLWEQDSLGFLKRVDKYLTMADSKNIKTLFVLLDDVWHPVPQLGKQRDDN